MSRSKLREQIFKLLFRVEFNVKDEMQEQELLFFHSEENIADEADTKYILDKYSKIVQMMEELDRKINDFAECWTTDRMGKVDLTILRLAVYEILMDEDIPASVAINEAVELAKKFGQDESPKFINGILAKFT